MKTQEAMKKEIRNYKGEFIETYNKEVTPERKEKLHADLAKIESNKDKIAFLKKEKLNYLQNISPTVLESSGTVSLPNFKTGEPLFFDRYIQLEIQKLSGGRFNLELEKNPKPKARAIALFCSIVHQTGILIKGFEGNETYCQRVCETFNIESNPKSVRKYFSEQMGIKKTDKNLITITEIILPTLPEKKRQIIINYIESKNLYG